MYIYFLVSSGIASLLLKNKIKEHLKKYIFKNPEVFHLWIKNFKKQFQSSS